MYDIIIKNGLIVDGSGADGIRADIAIVGDEIVQIGLLQNAEAKEVIDAAGLTITPGFIDMHSHADQSSFCYPKMENYLMQGITSCFTGHCGHSMAPIDSYWQYQYLEADVLDKIKPYCEYEEKIVDLEAAKQVLKEVFDLDISWRSFGEYLETVERQGLAANLIPLVGHGQIRGQVMGYDHKRLATAEEIERMKAHVAEAMEAGAFGYSTGLDYAPGYYANTTELIELAKVLQPYDGIYSTHWRRTGLRLGTPKKQKKTDGVIEALEIAKATGLRVQISHLWPCYDVYPAGNDMMSKASAAETLRLIDQYRDQGVRASFDVIPGQASLGLAQTSHLASCFVVWVRQAGSLAQFARNILADDYVRDLVSRVNRGEVYTFNPVINPQWDESLHITDADNKGYVGKSIAQIAGEKGMPSVETVISLLREQIDMKSISFDHNIEGVKELLRHPEAMPGTDSMAFDLESAWHGVVEKSGRFPSTKTYCMTVKFLLEVGEGRLEDKVRKLSGKPADVIGIGDRGYIRQGFKADIVMLDMEGLATNENYVDPRAFPSGISYVIVNGVPVVEKGVHNGKLPGKVIRK